MIDSRHNLQMAHSTTRANARRRLPPRPWQHLGGMLVLTASLGCQPQQTLPRKAARPTPATIEVGVVPARIVEQTVVLPATVESDAVAHLAPKVEAYVERVLVDIGAEVQEGETLVELRAPELEQRVRQVRQQIEQLTAQADVYQAELDAARSDLTEQEAESSLRGRERDRLSRLVGSGALSRQRLEEADLASESATAAVSRYENAMRVAEARIQQAKAEKEVAAAKLREAEIFAGYLELKAPFNGVVTRRNVDRGNLVRPGDATTQLLTIAKVDRLRAVLHATTDVSGRLEVGQTVRFRPDDSPDEQFVAPIARISGAYDERTRMMRVEVDLPNEPDASGRRPLRSGAYGSAEIVVAATDKKVPAIPPEALLTEEDQAVVAVVAEGRCHYRPVVVGLAGDELLAIDEGLSPGTQIVASRVAKIEDGEEVTMEQLKQVQW